jgi:[acyl-carrier-protein] S-malonyltransferase
MYEAGLKRPGTMAAVIGMEADDLERVLKEARKKGVVQIANLNSPTQIVISGEVDAVGYAVDVLPSRGARRVIPLKVSGAFHTELLTEARDGLQSFLESVPIESPQCVFVANVTGGALTDPADIRANLVRQIVEPVRWVECVRALSNRKASLMIEVGPGSVLRGLARKIEPDVRTMGAGTLQDIEKLLAALTVG